VRGSTAYPPSPDITAPDGQFREWLRAVRSEPGGEPNDKQGRSAVLVAVLVDDLESLTILLDGGAPPNPPHPTSHQTPPLHAAVQLGRIEMVQVLLEHGASLTVGGEGRSVFGFAAKRGDDGVMETLLETAKARHEEFDGLTGCGTAFIDDALCEAARHGRAQWIDRLLDAGADINAVQTGMYTPLINATIQGHAEVIRSLLKRGARVDAAPSPGRSALYYASTAPPATAPSNHFPELAQVLGEFGARARAEMLITNMINRRMDQFAILLTMNPRPEDLLEVLQKSIISTNLEAVQRIVDAKLPDGSPAVKPSATIVRMAERHFEGFPDSEVRSDAIKIAEILKAAAESR
jgi:hypothetical protein